MNPVRAMIVIVLFWCCIAAPSEAFEDLKIVKQRNGVIPNLELDGEPNPDPRQWIEFGNFFRDQWKLLPSKNAVQLTRIPVEYLSIKDFRCKWGRPALTISGTIYLCPASVVWYSEFGSLSIVSLFAQSKWGRGEEYWSYASSYYIDYAAPKWINEVASGTRKTMFCTSWMLLYYFDKGLPARQCNPASAEGEFRRWWKQQYDAAESTPASHIVRYWDAQRSQFWLTINFLLAHEGGHVLLNHESANSGLITKQEIEADRFAVRFLIEAGNDPLEILGVLGLLRFSSAIIHRSATSPVEGRVEDLSSQMKAEIQDLLQDGELWSNAAKTLGAEVVEQFKSQLRASGFTSFRPPWEAAR